MVTFKCKLYIGKYVFRHLIDLKIESSRKSLGDTATIKLANPSRRLDTELKVGDEVKVWLGYDGEMNLEFQGYISAIKPNHPFEIECEDEVFKLKRTTVKKAWSSVTLKQLIRYLVPDAELAEELPDMTLSPFRLDNVSKAKALLQLKDDYGLDVYFRKGKLFAGLAYTDLSVPGKVVYDFQRNIIPRSCELVYRKKEDVVVKLKAIGILANGSKIEETVGDEGGEEFTKVFPGESNKSHLKAMAINSLDEYKYNGYLGSFKTWLLPYPQHGQVAVFFDREHPERRGSNFIDSITTEVSKSGGCRRTIKPGRRAE